MTQDYQTTEAIIQFLFAFDFAPICQEELIQMMMKEVQIPKKKATTLFDIASLIWQQREPLDQLIKERSIHYEFDRIGGVEKSILRYAFFTLQDKEQTATLVMKEAMRLAKKFSTPDSAKYVNAILDAQPAIK